MKNTKKMSLRLLCGLLSLLLFVSPLTGVVSAAEGTTAPTHVDPLADTLIKDGFSDPTKWDIFNEGTTKVADGKATIKGAGPNNRLGWNEGKLEADKFMISLDVTPNMVNEKGQRAADLKIVFKGTDQYEGDRLQVRFSFDESLVLVERRANTGGNTWGNEDYRESFEWNQGETIGVDVLVDSSTSTVTVYLDGVEVAKADHEDIGTMERGYFAITGQYPNQDFVLENLNVTSAVVVEEKPDVGADGHLTPLAETVVDGVLFNDTSKWTPKGAAKVSEDGKTVTMSEAGPDNGIEYNEVIKASDFLISMDVTPLMAAGSAADFKVDFFKTAAPGTAGNHAQVRLKFQNNLTKIGVTSANNAEPNDLSDGNIDFPEGVTWTTGEKIPLDIRVNREADTIEVYIGGTKIASTAKGADLGVFSQGYFGFSAQYGQQNFKVENVKVTATSVTATPEVNKTDLAIAVRDAKANQGTENTGDVYTADSWAAYEEALKEAEAELARTDSTNESVKAALDKLTAAVAGLKVSAITHAFDPFSRVLADDDFSDPNISKGNWHDGTNANTTVTFTTDGMTVKGSGKNNWVAWSLNTINASKFLIQFDVTPGAGNNNANFKAAFKAQGLDGGSEWLQLRVRSNSGQEQALIEHTTSHDSSQGQLHKVLAQTQEKEFSYLTVPGRTAAIDILVDGDTITLYVNGNKDAVLTAKHDLVSSLANGYVAFEGEYPNQEFTVDNFKVSTDETPSGEKYTVKVESSTDGKRPDATGGTVTADKTEGYDGDLVTLTVTPKHGYVFDHFESYKADGTSTDGLLTITNNRFVISEKTGSVTVVACFKTYVPPRFELWNDDFDYEKTNEEGKHTGHIDNGYTESGVEIVDGQLKLTGSVLPKLDYERLDGENYRMSFDIKKGNTEKGTIQLGFKGASGTDASKRYALRLNGTTVDLIYFENGNGAKQIGTPANLAAPTADAVSHVVIEVVENTVTLTVDGTVVLTATVDGDNANWKDLKNVPSIYNMTNTAPVLVDNLLVEIIPTQVEIEVKTTLNGKEDPDHVAGYSRANVLRGVAGDVVTIANTVKAGYAVKGYTVAEPYAETVTVVDGKFTIPAKSTAPIVVTVDYTEAKAEARDYYIDSVGGNDANPGTKEAPWKSFTNLQSAVVAPGSNIYLKRGSTFDGQQLKFLGSGGTKDARITVTAYGEGNLPRLNGQGKVTNVVELFNQPYVTIEYLEITNLDPEFNSEFGLNTSNNNSKTLRAVNVFAKDYGVVSGIYIRNLYIHDINGTLGSKWNGGIFFDVQANMGDGKVLGLPTKYDDVRIENNTLIRVDRSAIKLVSSSWCNQWEANSPNVPVGWYPSTNVVVRGNYMEYIGGDGITVRDTDGALVENNLSKDARYQNTGYNVGIWPFEAANTVLQYNECYNTHSVQDGQGLDCDHASSYSLMQYNYSHNNEGGFMLIMAGYPNTGVTVRYNVSQNDYDKTFEFAQGVPKGTMIYNNTLYSEEGTSRGIFFLSNTGASGTKENNNNLCDAFIFNNLFYYPEGQSLLGGDDTHVGYLKEHLKLYNNGYAGGVQATELETKAVTANTGDKVLVAPGTAPEKSAGVISARNGKSGLLNGYKLAKGSVMIDKGITVKEALEHFGPEVTVKDGRSLSPREVYDQNKENSVSLSVAMGENFPRVTGARYDTDFFGVTVTGTPDIGAAEYADTAEAAIYSLSFPGTEVETVWSNEDPTLTIPKTVPESAGYEFKGWTLDGETVYQPGDKITLPVDGNYALSLRAVWAKTAVKTYTLTVEYVDGNGKSIAKTFTKTYEEGETYKVTPPAIKGYDYKGLGKGSAPLSGKMTGNVKVVLVYAASKSDESPKTGEDLLPLMIPAVFGFLGLAGAIVLRKKEDR